VLWRIDTRGSLARRLVERGRDAYEQDTLLALAAEAIMRRLADAVTALGPDRQLTSGRVRHQRAAGTSPPTDLGWAHRR